MNLTKTLGLLLVFGLLLAYVLKYERGEVEAEHADRQLAQLLGFKNGDAVVEITVQRPSGSFTIRRIEPKPADGEPEWQLTAPLSEPCDTAAGSFIDTLLTTTPQYIYGADKGAQLKDTESGLAKPEIALTLADADGRKATLQFGGKTPNDGGYFGRVEGQKGLLVFYTYFVETNLRDKKIGELRNKDLFDFETADVEGVKLAYPASAVELKKSGQEWTIHGAKPLAADTASVEGLLSSLSGARIEEFVEGATPELTSYGLDAPRITVTLTLKGGATKVLLVGAAESAPPPAPQPGMPETPPTEKLYVQRQGSPEVLQVAGTLYDQLYKTPADLRDKTVFPIQSEDVLKVQYTVNGQEVALAKQADAKPETDAESEDEGLKPAERPTWQMLKPVALKADSRAVEDLLSSCELLRATAFVDSPGDLAQYGLSQPRARIELEQAGGKKVVVLVGREAADKSGLYAKRDDSAVVMTVRATFLDDLDTSPNRLRDLSILALDRTLVQSIAIRQKSGALVKLEPTGGDSWKVTKPEEKDADAGRVGVVLTALEDLRGDEWMTDKADNLATYGLDKPDVIVTVTIKEQGKERVETIYLAQDPAGGLGVFIKRKGHDPVYRSDSGLVLSDLRKGPDDFKPFEQPAFDGMPPM